MAITLNGSSGVTTNTAPLAQDLTTSGDYYINNAVYDTGWTYDLSNASVAHHIGTNTPAPVRIRSNNTDGVIIDQAGRVTMPYQPAFEAEVSGSSGYYPLNGINGFLAGAVTTNIGNHFNASNSRFTAPVSGMYVFGFNYYYTPSSGSYAGGCFSTNTGRRVYAFTGGNLPDTSACYSQCIYLNVGDYVNFETYCADTSSRLYTSSTVYGYLLG